jgi:hypothetical protein
MDFAQRTIDLARRNVAEGRRPFATVIVKDGEVVAESPNRVAQTNDPTAHAEILANPQGLREAGHGAPHRHHHLRAGPPLSDVPGLALPLILASAPPFGAGVKAIPRSEPHNCALLRRAAQPCHSGRFWFSMYCSTTVRGAPPQEPAK